MKCRPAFLVSLVILTMAAAVLPSFRAHAETGEAAPRLMLVGDSWCGFMWGLRTFKEIFATNLGPGRYVEMGNRGAIMGSRAFEFMPDAYNYLEGIVESLEAHPTVDVVVITLGGNDFMMGTPGVDPLDPDREVEWEDCYKDPSLEDQWLFDKLASDIGIISDAVLAVRQDIRVAIVGYTFGGRQENFCTIEEQHQGFVGMELAKKALADTKDRVYYVHNLGLMQYHFGTIDQPPPVGPYPGSYPDYIPMPGGDPTQLVNHDALFDNDIHLTPEGYLILAQRAFDEFIGQWVSYPRALEIVLHDAKSPVYTFEITFSEPVSGVDATDFVASDLGGGKDASVVSVADTGDGVVYLVYVAVGGGGTPHLALVDDDTIVDLDSQPLGGPAIPGDPGNGGFDANGVYPFQDLAVPDPIDFDACLEWLDFNLEAYYVLLEEEGAVGVTFAPDNCDLNGNFQIEPDIVVEGNGMLDSLEYALINACYTNPNIDLRPNGIWHDRVVSAFDQNYARMVEDMGGAEGTICTVFPALPPILAALMTLGDPKSKLIPVLAGLAGAAIPENWPIVIHMVLETNYDLLPSYFGPDGDADGDGYTNAEEYAFFVPIGGRDLYVAGALNPAMTPDLECENQEGGTFVVGDSFCLIVPGSMALGAGFQWKKDGIPLHDGGFISGSNWRSLHILSLQLSDSGQYTCEYDDGSKAPAVFGPVEVHVVKGAPAAGMWGIAGLALACALGGARATRRRNR